VALRARAARVEDRGSPLGYVLAPSRAVPCDANSLEQSSDPKDSLGPRARASGRPAL